MGIPIGILLALLVCSAARLVGLERDRAFYPTALIAVASYDVLFAVMAGSASAIVLESVMASAFAVAALVGFNRSPWILVAGLAAHGFADLVHDSFSPGAGIPSWWPGFCAAFDEAMAAILASKLMRERHARQVTPSHD